MQYPRKLNRLSNGVLGKRLMADGVARYNGSSVPTKNWGREYKCVSK
ncbi:MAG: hypothetical protein M2R45_00296 [Verrucomicrobia subdivision 3 bacterium]|nr:hypothetical protein [Limisphaerales bacterium]MCS1412944.1 hypothetical protein [Limisphaerales bacterium]